MAWYSLYKWFIPWRKKPYTNWINWYSNKLYDEWFESLPPEKQQKVLDYQKKQKEQRERRAQQSLATMYAMMAMLREKCERTWW